MLGVALIAMPHVAGAPHLAGMHSNIPEALARQFVAAVTVTSLVFWALLGSLTATGYGQLPTMTEDYFETGLEKATGNDKAKPVVIYCLKSCWMSWNAAKRAISFGYTSIIWYPDGTDGWSDAGFDLEDRKPEPR